MKIFKSKKIVGVILSVIMILAISINTFAYNTFNNHVIVNGISGQFYYVENTAYWRTVFDNGFNRWYNTSTPFNFSRTSNQSASIVDCYTYSSNDNNYGYTAFFVNSRNVDPYSENWYWCKVYLNTISLGETSSDFDAGVACHEIGHICGLNHNNGNPGSIMCQVAYGRYVTTPQSDDINGVNFLY